MLLTSQDTYNAIIHHVVCNYISNPLKYKYLQMYIPPQFKSGHEYVVTSNMRNFNTWGTELEIITMAQMSGFDILVYTEQGVWVCYKSSITDNSHTSRASYLSNKSGYHFDPVFEM